MKYIALLIAIIMVSGCSINIPAMKIGNEDKGYPRCITLTDDAGIKKWDKVRKIILEEAKNAGFEKVVLDTKPTKYNNQSAKLQFIHVRFDEKQDTVFIEKNGNQLCFGGVGAEADPRNAIGAIQDRLKNIDK